MNFTSLLKDTENHMTGAMGFLTHSLNGLRTGRASPSLLDPIKVEMYGNFVPLNQIASISIPEPKMIVIQVWDKEAAKPVEKAIQNSDLGLNPQAEGNIIRVPIPDLSQERREQMAKTAARYGEEAKIAIRNVRRDALDKLKKAEKDGEITEDELRSYSDDIQKLTDKFIKQIDDSVRRKSEEITHI